VDLLLQEDPRKSKEAVQDFYAPAQIQIPKKHSESLRPLDSLL
jgi:hypothetical protein